MTTRALAVLAVVAATAGCTLGDPGPYDALRIELAERRAAWEMLGLVEYGFVMRRFCFCPEANEPYRVRVVADSVVSVVHAETGEPPMFDSPGLFPSVAGFFDLVRDAIDRDAATLEVDFHPDLHFPTAISIDYDARVIDEELGFSLSDLVSAERAGASRLGPD